MKILCCLAAFSVEMREFPINANLGVFQLVRPVWWPVWPQSIEGPKQNNRSLCGWLLLERGVHLSMCMWITYFGLLCSEKKPAKEIWRRNAQSWTVMDFLSLRFHLEVALWTFSWTFEFIWTSGQGVFEEVELTPYRSLYDGITDGRVKVDRWRHSEQNKDDKVHDINTKRIHKECTQHTQQSYILPK